MTVTIQRDKADTGEKKYQIKVNAICFLNLFFFLLFFLDIQTRPTFAREELTEADLDKMVASY